FDASPCPADMGGTCGRRDRYRLVPQLEDALGRNHRGLQNVVFFSYFAAGLLKKPRQLDEGYLGAYGGVLAYDLAAAVPDNQRDPDRADDFHRRIEDRVIENCIDIGFPVSAVDAIELVHLSFFAVEELDNGHSGDVLLQEGVYPGDANAHLSEGRPGAQPEPGCENRQQRQYGEGNKGQAPVYPEHPDHYIKDHC